MVWHKSLLNIWENLSFNAPIISVLVFFAVDGLDLNVHSSHLLVWLWQFGVPSSPSMKAKWNTCYYLRLILVYDWGEILCSFIYWFSTRLYLKCKFFLQYVMFLFQRTQTWFHVVMHIHLKYNVQLSVTEKQDIELLHYLFWIKKLCVLNMCLFEFMIPFSRLLVKCCDLNTVNVGNKWYTQKTDFCRNLFT